MLALTIANLKMLARNRQTTFWALFFPLILVVVFGLFDLNTVGSSSLAALDRAQSPASQRLLAGLESTPVLQLRTAPESLEAGRQLVNAGDLDYLVVIPQGFFSAAAGEGSSEQLVTLVLRTGDEERHQIVQGIVQRQAAGALAPEPPEPPPSLVETVRLEGRVVSYFDLVLLGLVGMGIMTHSIISIAVRISNYRNLSILKRMLVTPLAIWKFFAAEVAAQLVLALIQAAIILAVGVFIFQAQLNGNVLYLLPVIALGSLVFLNIGFILSAWANSPAAASGMGNVVAFPMMFFAGTFFSSSTLPWLLPYAAEALPLSPMIAAMREIALHEASLTQVWPELALLAGWVVATALIAVRVFRFSYLAGQRHRDLLQSGKAFGKHGQYSGHGCGSPVVGTGSVSRLWQR